MTTPAPLVITRHDDPAAFLAVAGESLAQQEALNNIPLGIVRKLVEGHRYGEEAPLLVTLTRGAAVVGTAFRTPPYPAALSRIENPEDIAQLAAWMRVHAEPIPAASGEASVVEPFAAAYLPPGAETEVQVRTRLFELREVLPVPVPPGRPRRADAGDHALVRSWWQAFAEEATPDHPHDPASADSHLEKGRVWIWEDASGDAACMVVRNRELPTGGTVGPVYTPPAARAHGYATALVAEVSRAILRDGKAFVCLLTDLSNPTSNSIYPKVGYRPIADLITLRFL